MDSRVDSSSSYIVGTKFYTAVDQPAREALSANGHTLQGHVVSLLGPTTTLEEVTGEAAAEALKKGTLIARDMKTGQFQVGPKVSKLAIHNLSSGQALIRGDDGQLRELGFKAQVSWMSAADTARYAAIFQQSIDEQRQAKARGESSTVLQGRVTLGDPNRFAITRKDAKNDKSDQKISKQFSKTLLSREKIDSQLNDKAITKEHREREQVQKDVEHGDDAKRNEIGEGIERAEIFKAGQTKPSPAVPKGGRTARAA